MKIIAQGAEAKIILKNDFIIKDRIKKSYRLSELDKKIRKSRTKAETKLLTKASNIIPSAKPLPTSEFNKIKIPYIDGLKLSNELNNFELKKQKEILKQIGKSISKLHKADLIHGDLTTSNMLYKNGEIYFIDFGLGFHSNKIEDKAVDIHVLKQALEAKHFQNWEKLFSAFKKAYKNKQVLERLKKVEKRGRYKH
jgi:TP53 regulating kinase-like protein